MTWETALEIVVERTRHERFRVLCDESHPDHEGARRTVITLAGGTPPPLPDPPPAVCSLKRR